MTSKVALDLPDIAWTVVWLRSLENPIVALGLARDIDRADPTTLARLRRKVTELPTVGEALAAQRDDGSWGDHDQPRRRLLPTLWMAKVLGEIGLDSSHGGWNAASEFLSHTAHTHSGVFSISGGRDGVLSCYVGIAGLMYAVAGRHDLAQPQIDWIINHQEVRVNVQQRRSQAVALWEPHLRSRYGGCMANTTCLVGLVRTGRALRAAVPNRAEANDVIEASRGAFLDRRIMFRGSGSIVPLSVTSAKAESWLEPAFPLDWRIDLIEVLDFLGDAGPPDPRMQDAVDRLVGFRLPDGTWPLRRTYRPEQMPLLERRSKTSGSPIVTLRAATAMVRLGATVSI